MENPPIQPWQKFHVPGSHAVRSNDSRSRSVRDPFQEYLASGRPIGPSEFLNLMAQKLHEAKISTAHLCSSVADRRATAKHEAWEKTAMFNVIYKLYTSTCIYIYIWTYLIYIYIHMNVWVMNHFVTGSPGKTRVFVPPISGIPHHQ